VQQFLTGVFEINDYKIKYFVVATCPLNIHC